MTPYEKLELHLSPAPLSRKHAKQIKACGGSYRECRSIYASKRFVLVPASERYLIDDLVRTYRSQYRETTMIARTKGNDIRPAWVIVHDVNPRDDTPPTEQLERKYAAACAQAVQRGIVKED